MTTSDGPPDNDEKGANDGIYGYGATTTVYFSN